MFNKRLEKAIIYNNYNFKNKIKQNEILDEIQIFSKNYSNLLNPGVWEDDLLDLKINEFDLILTIFESIYQRCSHSLFDRSFNLWENDNRHFEISIVYQLRFIFHDIIALRNFCSMKFENQFNATFRNLIEKVNILALCLFDKKFFEIILFNSNSIDEKKLYFNFIRPSKIKKRVKDNLNSIIKNEKLSKAVFYKIDKLFYQFIVGDTLDDIYSLSSLFVHNNNYNDLLKYYNEGGKFNVSSLHNASSYYHYRLDYAIEYLLLLQKNVSDSLKTKGVKGDLINCEKIDLGYFSVLIDEKYKK